MEFNNSSKLPSSMSLEDYFYEDDDAEYYGEDVEYYGEDAEYIGEPSTISIKSVKSKQRKSSTPPIVPKTKNVAKKSGLYKEEVWMGHLMGGVTQKYLEFLDGCGDDTKAEKAFGIKVGPVIPTCAEPIEEIIIEDEEGEGTGKLTAINPFAHAIMERPAAMVGQSSFLKKLEHQIKHELARTGCSIPVYDMAWVYDDSIELKNTAESFTQENMGESEDKMLGRLSIYRRGFSALILHFDALNPLLQEIKMNYDDLILTRQEQLKEANSTRKSISHATKELDVRMENLHFEGMKQLSDTEKQCYTLMKYVDRQDAAIHTMTDILNRLENSLSEEHDLRRDSEDQKVLLMVEINDLRRKLGMPPRSLVDENYVPEEEQFVEQEEQIITPDDPMILNASLESTTKTLEELEAKLAALEEEYKDVTPRCDLEDLKTLLEDTKEDSTRCVEMFELETSQLKQHEDQIIKLDTEYSTLEESFEEMKVKLTPRPSWLNLAEVIEGGLTKWKKMIDGKSSDDIAKKLVEELSTPKIPGPPEYITGLGSDEKIPPYMRFEGRIRSRKLVHRDISIFIENIWATRIEELENLAEYNESRIPESDTEEFNENNDELQEAPIILDFESFITKYFEKNYPSVNQRMEWVYNLIETCRNFKEIYTQYSRFLNILEGKIDEAVYHLLRAEIRIIIEVLVRRSLEAKLPPGSITLGTFIKCMEEIFSTRTEEQITRLIDAASKQTGVYAEWSILDYAILFDIADEGITGHFFDELALQLDEDRSKFATEVLTVLVNDLGASINVIDKDDPSGDKPVGLHQVYQAFKTADPLITKDRLGAALAWIFMGVSTAPEQCPRGLKLVEYVQDRIQFQNFDYEEDDSVEDDKFKRALFDIIYEPEDLDEHETARQRKQKFKKFKTSTLRTIVQKIKGGAFIRSGFITLRAAEKQRIPENLLSGTPSLTEARNNEFEEDEEEDDQQQIQTPAPVVIAAAAPIAENKSGPGDKDNPPAPASAATTK